jgi:hypothetical protein
MAFEPHPSTTALARTVTNQHAEIYIYRLSPHTAGCPTSICDHISIVLIEHSRSCLFHLRKWRVIAAQKINRTLIANNFSKITRDFEGLC